MVYANDDILDMFRGLPCNMFSLPLSIPILNNPYHKRCDALRSFLVDNDFSIECVSRSHIGEKWYYNIHLNKHTVLQDIDLKQLLNIDNIGLVYYDTKTKHSIILVDEDELHGKYLRDGELDFNLIDNIFNAIEHSERAEVIRIINKHVNTDIVKNVDIDFQSGLLYMTAPLSFNFLELIGDLFKKDIEVEHYSVFSCGDDNKYVFVLNYKELLDDGC